MLLPEAAKSKPFANGSPPCFDLRDDCAADDLSTRRGELSARRLLLPLSVRVGANLNSCDSGNSGAEAAFILSSVNSLGALRRRGL